MAATDIVRAILDQKGIRQAWVVAQMNAISPHVSMSPCKFSAVVCGRRKMTGDELIAFCRATETDPDMFFDQRDTA